MSLPNFGLSKIIYTVSLVRHSKAPELDLRWSTGTTTLPGMPPIHPSLVRILPTNITGQAMQIPGHLSKCHDNRLLVCLPTERLTISESWNMLIGVSELQKLPRSAGFVASKLRNVRSGSLILCVVEELLLKRFGPVNLSVWWASSQPVSQLHSFTKPIIMSESCRKSWKNLGTTSIVFYAFVGAFRYIQTSSFVERMLTSAFVSTEMCRNQVRHKSNE